MKNKKQSKIKIVLPVLFTFGASLMFFQADSQADSTQTTTSADQQVALTTNVNTTSQNTNYQSLNQSTDNQQDATQANTQTAVAGANDGVSLNDQDVQQANSKPVIDTNPGFSTNQYNVTATPVSSSNGTNGTNGAASLNTAGLSSWDINFLNSIHDGALNGWRQYGVLPSVTAAQAILESGWGQSGLATQGHNLFGIKGSYNGHSITMPTREVYGGRSFYINDAFRAYANNNESVQDHGRFLAVNSRYHNLLWQTDYRTVTRLIQADGYATDPYYASSLNAVIERYGLTAWDREVAEINTGHIDNLSVIGNQINIQGWHASDSYNSKMHHFIILLDGSTGKELYRTEVSGYYRQDVQNAYPNADISGWGGFNINIPYSSTFAGKNIQVVSRYTYNTNGEPNGGKDIYFNPISLNANTGCLDNMSLDAKTGTINIAGWHAADASLNKKYHFIIIFDGSKQVELGRFLVESGSRDDVAKAYNIYGANKSGFSLKLNFNPALAGDQIQVISRYSDSQNGEGNNVDYWFAPKTFSENRAYLDSLTVNGNQLHVAGWHAADQSIAKPYHFIIIYDATTHQEVKRQMVESLSRNDVQNACPNIYNDAQSGFDLITTLDPSLNGHEIQIISRYSDAKNGEGNRVDYWFNPVKVTIR
ncbi:glycoside hydrolase family 73 protein [Limosilactobacillus panis]|uniref:glycoside hydrolase family 73 protein n=1 Tax=Limosilactobacillus panis TaxID=47493 RepID=UPI000699EB40|nr:glycoside hydrolase family 73 protein [Limosilactobacillus panis]